MRNIESQRDLASDIENEEELALRIKSNQKEAWINKKKPGRARNREKEQKKWKRAREKVVLNRADAKKPRIAR